MSARLGLFAASLVLLPACFNPPETPLGTDSDASSGGSTTDPSPEDTGSEGPVDSSTGPGMSPCLLDPCENGGECIAGDGDDRTCVCPEGFSGDDCEIESEDPCLPSPCDNGGTCIVGMEGAVCECPQGFDGDACEIDIDECAGGPCLNGGTCTDEVAGFSCECPGGFEGELCDVNIDDCAESPCVNGMCVDGIEAFECSCGMMFEGDLCECVLEGSSQVSYSNQGTFTSATVYNDPPGVTVLGSNTVNVLNLNGLGIVGGVNNNTIDGNEWIEFQFDHPSAATSYFVQSAGNQNGDGVLGAAFLEAWDEANVPVGATPIAGTGNFNLNALFGAGTRISRFRVTANVDSHRIGSVTVSPVVCP